MKALKTIVARTNFILLYHELEGIRVPEIRVTRELWISDLRAI